MLISAKYMLQEERALRENMLHPSIVPWAGPKGMKPFDHDFRPVRVEDLKVDHFAIIKARDQVDAALLLSFQSRLRSAFEVVQIVQFPSSTEDLREDSHIVVRFLYPDRSVQA